MNTSDEPTVYAGRRCVRPASALVANPRSDKGSALSDPTHKRNVDFGLTEAGDRKADAVRKIEEAFEDLGNLLNHVAIIDMAGAFELVFRTRLGNAVGEIRRVVKEEYESGPFWASREDLVHQIDDFQGLRKISALLSGRMSKETADALSAIRENRNRFAHGTDIRTPPTITSEEAREALNDVIGIIG